MPKATVIIPTHDHHLTLPMTLRSVAAQTVADLEVLIVGDGVGPELRAAATEFAESDSRFVFLDLPKGEHHGELYLDVAVRRAQSPAIFYLCDDDLLLPRHIENLLPLLSEADLVQSRNGYVDLDGELHLYPTDLGEPEAVAWHLAEPRRNCVSFTGTAHRRESYLQLDRGWTIRPEGEWLDHYMWKKFLRCSWVRAATHPEMTAVQLPTSGGREHMDQRERADELRVWADRLALPDGHEWLQEWVARVTPAQLDRTHRDAVDAGYRITCLEAELAAERAELSAERAERAAERAEAAAERAEAAALAVRLESELENGRERSGQLEALRVQVRTLQERRRRERVRSDRALAKAEAELRRLHSSRSWRLTAPLRTVRAVAGRVRR